ncbi:MAG: DoxX family membrane protein [Verrucomicrobiota bacterium]
MIHCLITREVREGKEAEFEAAVRSFFSDAICDTNTAGAQLVAPVNESSRTYGILRSFPDDAARDAFYASDGFRAWSEYVSEFVEGEAVRKELNGLEAFFRDEGPAGPPPTWKMAIITWLGVNFTTTPLLLVLMPLLVGTYGIKFPFDNFVFNVFVVALLSWLVMPAIAKLFDKWLHAKPAKPAEPSKAKQSGVPKFLAIFFDSKSYEPVRDRAIAAFALFLGITTAMLHGWPKLVGAFHYFTKAEPWRDIDLVVALGLPFPAIMATFAGCIQFFCSLALSVGFLTRINSIMVGSTLIVALYWNAAQGKDNQVALLYFAGFTLLAVINGGRMSLDSFINQKKVFA